MAELDAGVRRPAEGTNPSGRPWADLTESERRQVVDAHRLAYRSDAVVNWCPGLGTVLANEEVTPDGRSERGNFPVYRRPLTQWMMRITAYADRLIDDLDTVDWPESVAQMQRNWIGRSVGARVRFGSPGGDIEVFTTRPDTLFGATYVVLAPEHPLVGTVTADSWPEGTPAEWTAGAGTPAQAVAGYREARPGGPSWSGRPRAGTRPACSPGRTRVNPVSGQPVPIFVADYVLMGYGTGAIMAVPAHDQRDLEFAQRFGLPVTMVVQPPDELVPTARHRPGHPAGAVAGGVRRTMVGRSPPRTPRSPWTGWARTRPRPGSLTGWRRRAGARPRSRTSCGTGCSAGSATGASRSRSCTTSTGLPIALPESMLPVELPEMSDFSPRTYDGPGAADSEPEPPLSRLAEWVEVELDLGDGPRKYRRETNTMPQWAGSCWYEIRYLDPTNSERFVDPEVERYWMGPTAEHPTGGVDLYVGGVEHAVLHLLYARFWQKVLFDLGHVSAAEPFARLFNQGYIQAAAYVDERGFHVPAAAVVEGRRQASATRAGR